MLFRSKKSSKVRRGGKHHAGRKGTRKNNGFNNKAKFSTVTTYVGAINIPASTSAYRLDILPTLSVFPIDTTATRFQTYKPRRIRYKLLPRFNISSTPGTLPVIYTVPVQSHLIPAPTPAAFTAFADCKIQSWTRTHSGSFAPMMYQDSA